MAGQHREELIREHDPSSLEVFDDLVAQRRIQMIMSDRPVEVPERESTY